MHVSIQVPDTPFNVDLSNHGDATPGTPVELWGKWQGVNQTWKFQKGKCTFYLLFIASNLQLHLFQSVESLDESYPLALKDVRRTNHVVNQVPF